MEPNDPQGEIETFIERHGLEAFLDVASEFPKYLDAQTKSRIVANKYEIGPLGVEIVFQELRRRTKNQDKEDYE